MIFHSYVSLPEGKCHHFPHFFWLVVDLPLWKIWVRQLGWWHSQLNGKIKFMFQTTNQSCSLWKTTITYSWTTIKPPFSPRFSFPPGHRPALPSVDRAQSSCAPKQPAQCPRSPGHDIHILDTVTFRKCCCCWWWLLLLLLVVVLLLSLLLWYNNTWWLITLSKQVSSPQFFEWIKPYWMNQGYNLLSKWDEPPSKKT